MAVIHMPQRQFFFQGYRFPLFGSLHGGDGRASTLGFVFSHAWGEEKLWSHRTFVSLADALAGRGHPVLRFDYTGAGDSGGHSTDTTLETHMSDLASAVRALHSACPHLQAIGVVGCRLGASIAARYFEASAADGGDRNGPLVLVEPIMNGAAYLQSLLRSNLSAQLAAHGKVIADRNALRQAVMEGGTVDIEGYEIARSFLESFSLPDLLDTGRKRHEAPTLVVQIGSAIEAAPRPELFRLASTYPRGEVRVASEEPFWKESRLFYSAAQSMQSAIFDWLGHARA